MYYGSVVWLDMELCGPQLFECNKPLCAKYRSAHYYMDKVNIAIKTISPERSYVVLSKYLIIHGHHLHC